MSAWLIVLTGIIYFYVAMEQLLRFGNFPMFYAYIGYSFANIGLFLMAAK